MENKTKKMLQKDSIAELEKIVGKNCHEFNESEQCAMLLHGIVANMEKNDYFKNLKDTYSSMSWIEFKTRMKEHGFKIAYSYFFKGDYRDQDEFVLWYLPKKGLIVTGESYGKNLNSGTLYGEIKAYSKEDSFEIFNWLSTGGMLDKEELIFSTSHDVREGLFAKLAYLETYGIFLKTWTEKNKWLWFLDYTEKNMKDYDYKAITKSKIEKCPEEFKNIIG